ncbi:MAG: hypothetical protein Fur0015_07360 [Ignavibacteriales bacterium]
MKKLDQEIKTFAQKLINMEINTQSEIKFNDILQTFEETFQKLFEDKKSTINNLKKVELARTEFLGNVSHELRTPIFAIQGFIETLLNGAIDDKNVNKIYLEKAFKHTENLNNLLNDLIDISMIESGKMRMSFRYFNLYEFLSTIHSEHVNTATNKNLTLILECKNSGLMVYGDLNRLKQVMNNLIQNAIKYTDEGEIKISASDFGNKVEISVKDTGTGIPKEDLTRIFERFYRVDKDRSRLAGGTGLGLAIVKHIIEAHNEKIQVESNLGEGTKFSFFLRK